MSRTRQSDAELRIQLRTGLPSPTAAWDNGASLARLLLTQPGVQTCEITVNANRRQVVSWRSREGQLTVSVHWALLEHTDDLVRLVTTGDRTAWARLRRVLPQHTPLVDDPQTSGKMHDLQQLVAAERTHLRRDIGPVRVTWGRWSANPPMRSLRLGSCDAGDPPSIRIHPVLDHRFAPAWFVGFVLFHELLHVVHPPIDRGLRREVHPASFRAAERRHPQFEHALRWERDNIDELLALARRRGRD